MSSHFETPRLFGEFGENHSARGPNDLVLGERDTVCSTGDWRPDELRVVSHARGQAVIYGDCLGTDQEIERALDRTLTTDDPRSLTQLPGSYTTMVFEPDRLTVLGDLVGQYPWFYRRDGQNGIAFGTVTEPLRAAMDAPDGITAAARIAIPPPNVTELIDGRSATQGISQLQAGHMLRADRQGDVRVTPYETFQTPTTTSIDEAAEALRRAMLDSAGRRAASGYRMSSDFSGGLDSTTAAYLLAKELRALQAGPLLSLTHYPAGSPSDDLEHVRRYLSLPESEGLFDARELSLPPSTYYADVEHAPGSDEPDPSVIRRGMIQAYSQFLRDHGIQLHIRGTGGDCLLDMDPRLYLYGLARLRTLGKFGRSVLEAARINLESPLDLLRDLQERSRIDPVTNLRLSYSILRGQNSAEVLRHGGRIFGPEAAPQWLTPRARRQLADFALARAEELDVAADYDAGNHNAYLNLRSLARTQHGAMQYAAGFGLRRRAPYMDNDVIRACLSLPAHLRVNPWTFKAILGRAMEGLVPSEVTSRTTKGAYTAPVMAGLRAAHQTLIALLDDSRLADLGIINPTAIRETLDRVHAGAAMPGLSLDEFIAHELWLRRLDPPRTPGDAPPIVATPEAPPESILPPLPHIQTYSMPKTVFVTTRPEGAVAFNITGGTTLGTYHPLNREATAVLKALRNSKDLGGALTLLAAQYPAVDEVVLQNGTSRVIRKLLEQGILLEGSGGFSIAEGRAATQDVSPAFARRQKEIKVPLRDYPAALGGFVAHLALKRLPFARRLEIISSLHRRWIKKPATEAEAVRLLAAVQRVSAPYLGQVACMEQSMATVLAAAIKRRRVDLVWGTRANPDVFHVWPEVDGVPVSTASNAPIEGSYVPVYKI